MLLHELPGSLSRETVLTVHYPGNPLPRSTLWQSHTPPEPVVWFYFFVLLALPTNGILGKAGSFSGTLWSRLAFPGLCYSQEVCSLWYSGALSTCCQLFAFWGTKKKMTWKEKELVVNHLSLLDV